MCAVSRLSNSTCCIVDETMTMDSSTMSQENYNILSKLPGNNECIDCGNAQDTEWADVSFGVRLCTRCSRSHKKSKSSQVRSIHRDSWTSEHLHCMKLGGNERFRAYLELRDFDFAGASMEERYSSEAARDYHQALKAMVQEAMEQEKDDETVDMDESMDASIVLTKPGDSDSQEDTPFIIKALSSIVSLPARSRSGTEDTITVDGPDEEEEPCNITKTEDELAYSPELQHEGSIITRIISRQPVTSLDSSATKYVRQCLEENKDNQSILYKWTAANMTPTVTYMGRKFQADEAAPAKPATTTKQEHLPTNPPAVEGHTSFVARMGLSWSTEASDEDPSEFDEDYKEYLKCLTDDDFSKLKAALKQEGVKTNLCLGLLYKVAKSPCSLPEPKRSRSKSVDETPIPRSRWERHPDAMATDPNEEEGEDEDRNSLIVISRCA